MKKKLMLLGMVLCFSLLLQENSRAEKNYVFGVHPFKSPAKLAKMFKPLQEYLGQELNAKVNFRSAKDYESALDALAAGEVDISYLGPALFAIIDKEHPGKIRIAGAILNDGKPTFKGVIIARQDSGINTLEDLKGKRFAFGDRKSTLSCYMPAYMLMQAGVFEGLNYNFIGSHDNVALGVLKKSFEAGGVKPAVAKQYLSQGLKIIAESEPVYEHMIVVGPKVTDEDFKKIQTALLTVKDANIYTSIKQSITGFTKVDPSNYDNLKKVIEQVDAKIAK
ncbi:MAG: phosphate/phosphite/phosphonate ABC transporter substrate-binding protein [Desulfobulbaceae bacterium]|nr:phosphate/phosphite/phosphonate ABC transporter substrate-binding protein [Desulfobulbaceae bacterium]